MFTRWRAVPMARIGSPMFRGLRWNRIAELGLLAGASLLVVARTGPPAPIQSTHSSPAAVWLEFDTDACGEVDRVEGRRSAAKTIRADMPDSGDDGDEEDEWVNAWNMSPAESEQLNDWLSLHPEIATLTNAIQKSCDGQVETDPDALDDPETLEIA